MAKMMACNEHQALCLTLFADHDPGACITAKSLAKRIGEFRSDEKIKKHFGPVLWQRFRQNESFYPAKLMRNRVLPQKRRKKASESSRRMKCLPETKYDTRNVYYGAVFKQFSASLFRRVPWPWRCYESVFSHFFFFDSRPKRVCA